MEDDTPKKLTDDQALEHASQSLNAHLAQVLCNQGPKHEKRPKTERFFRTLPTESGPCMLMAGQVLGFLKVAA